MAGEFERRGSGPLQDVAFAKLVEKLKRLAELNIHLVPLQGLENYYVFARERFVALVRKTGEGFGPVGSAGLLTEQGMAVVIWKHGKPYFVAKNWQSEATEEEIARLRKFANDLEQVIKSE